MKGRRRADQVARTHRGQKTAVLEMRSQAKRSERTEEVPAVELRAEYGRLLTSGPA